MFGSYLLKMLQAILGKDSGLLKHEQLGLAITSPPFQC